MLKTQVTEKCFFNFNCQFCLQNISEFQIAKELILINHLEEIYPSTTFCLLGQIRRKNSLYQGVPFILGIFWTAPCLRAQLSCASFSVRLLSEAITQKCSIKNATLKNFAIFTGKHIKKRLQTGVFLWILRNI